MQDEQNPQRLKQTDAFYGENRVLPMWVADMDFACPEPVIEALVARARRGGTGPPPDGFDPVHFTGRNRFAPGHGTLALQGIIGSKNVRSGQECCQACARSPVDVRGGLRASGLSGFRAFSPAFFTAALVAALLWAVPCGPSPVPAAYSTGRARADGRAGVAALGRGSGFPA